MSSAPKQNNLRVNSSFDVSGGDSCSEEIRLEIMKQPDNSRTHSPATAEMETTPAEAEEQARAQVGKKRSRNGKAVSGGESEHEMHILTERGRRKKMRNMFSNLHALLPHLPPKVFDLQTVALSRSLQILSKFCSHEDILYPNYNIVLLYIWVRVTKIYIRSMGSFFKLNY